MPLRPDIVELLSGISDRTEEASGDLVAEARSSPAAMTWWEPAAQSAPIDRVTGQQPKTFHPITRAERQRRPCQAPQ